MRTPNPWRVVLAAAMALLLSSLSTATWARPGGGPIRSAQAIDLTGDWDWTRTAQDSRTYSSTPTITHDVDAGTFTWDADGASGSGTVSGTDWEMDITEDNGLTSHDEGTILENGNRIEGEWTQSDGQSGTTVATRIGQPPAPSTTPLTLYGVTYEVPGRLIQIDPTTGEGTEIGVTDHNSYDTLETLPDGNLLAISGCAELVRIDPSSAASTPIGTVSGTAGVEGLAYGKGTLYGSASGSCNYAGGLIRIDPATGAGTDVGPFGSGFGDLDGLAINAAGTLFGSDYSNGFLARINADTGAAVSVGNLGTRVYGLDFSPGGQLYGVGDGPQGTHLYTIDTKTAAITDVGPVGFVVTGIAFVGDEVPPQCDDPGAICGGSEDEELQGTPEDEFIFGAGGNDNIDGGGGNDVIVGGDGNDVINGGAGKDKITGGAGKDRIVGDRQGSNPSASVHAAQAASSADNLSGGAGNDTVLGQAGNDKLKGDTGNDLLKGGPGVNDFNGGPGKDHCVLDNKKDKTKSCEKKTLNFTLNFWPTKLPS